MLVQPIMHWTIVIVTELLLLYGIFRFLCTKRKWWIVSALETKSGILGLVVCLGIVPAILFAVFVAGACPRLWKVNSTNDYRKYYVYGDYQGADMEWKGCYLYNATSSDLCVLGVYYSKNRFDTTHKDDFTDVPAHSISKTSGQIEAFFQMPPKGISMRMSKVSSYSGGYRYFVLTTEQLSQWANSSGLGIEEWK